MSHEGVESVVGSSKQVYTVQAVNTVNKCAAWINVLVFAVNCGHATRHKNCIFERFKLPKFKSVSKRVS